jgi:CRP-like cAMP-binding protein
MPVSPAIDTVERVLFLKRSPQMAGLSAAELSAIAEQMSERSFQAASVILREGEPVGSTYVIVEGRVRITHRGRPVAEAGPGSALAAIAVLSRDYERFQAVAETDVLALELDAETLLEIFEDHFDILRRVIEVTARRLLELRGPELLAEAPLVDMSGAKARGMDLVERILFMRRKGPFRNSSINALAELAHSLREVSFDPGVTLWNEGDPSGSVLVLLSGSVRCTASEGSLFRVGPGCPVGDLESVALETRRYSAVTEAHVNALAGSVDGLMDVLEDNFEMAVAFLANLARQSLDLVERLAVSGHEMRNFLFLTEEGGFTSRHLAP